MSPVLRRRKSLIDDVIMFLQSIFSALVLTYFKIAVIENHVAGRISLFCLFTSLIICMPREDQSWIITTTIYVYNYFI